MSHLAFKYPYFLLLFVPYAALLWYRYRRGGTGDLQVSVSSKEVTGVKSAFRAATYGKLDILRYASLALLIIALAGPGRGITYSSIKNYGIDIMLVLDLSGSMRGEDFQPENRLTVAKKVVDKFVEGRPVDRMGLVVFAGDAYLQCPLTAEHGIIREILGELDFDTVDGDGTAIGDAVTLAASRMTEGGARSKVILLITDGMNNRGEIDPETAARTCASAGIKVYTVGIGKDGLVPYPGPFGSVGPKNYIRNHFDGKLLAKVAEITGGRYYRAESSGVFSDNMNEIDRLEKTETETVSYFEFENRTGLPLVAGAILFFTEILLRSAVYRKLP